MTKNFFRIYLITLILGVLLIIYRDCCVVPTAYNFVEWKDGWTIGTELVNVNNIHSSACITKKVDFSETDNALFFRVKNLNVDVYIDKELVYTSQSLMPSNTRYKTPGTYFCTIPLDNVNSDTVIKLDIHCPYLSKSSCSIKNMYIGNELDIFKHQTFNMLYGFSFCIVLEIIGVLFVACYFLLKEYETLRYETLYMGTFSIVFGVWSCSETKLLHLLTNNTVTLHLITGIFLLLLTTPIFLFFNYKYEITGYRPVRIIGISSTIAFLISITLHMLSIADLHELIWIAHLVLVMAVVGSAVYAFKLYKINTEDNGIYDYTFYGLSVIVICTILDISLYYAQLLTDNSTLTRFAILLYLIFFGYQIFKNYLKMYKANEKAILLEELAYVDILTGLSNKNAYLRDVELLNKNISLNNGRFIVVLDVNGLKYINDTYGHLAGDDAIKKTAEFLKITFAEKGNVYRVGGDEFACIMQGIISLEEIKNIHQVFNTFLESFNNSTEHFDYVLEVSCGYTAVEDKDKSIGDTFNRADEIMYVNKRTSKNYEARRKN